MLSFSFPKRTKDLQKVPSSATTLQQVSELYVVKYLLTKELQKTLDMIKAPSMTWFLYLQELVKLVNILRAWEIEIVKVMDNWCDHSQEDELHKKSQ